MVRTIEAICVVVLLGLGTFVVQDQAVAADARPAYFAVQIKVGPNWDDDRAPAEQAFFKEHSANLQRLREEGHIVMGARYSDIGLIVFSAPTLEAVRAFMDADPAMMAGTFGYEVHPINIFYPWRDEAER